MILWVTHVGRREGGKEEKGVLEEEGSERKRGSGEREREREREERKREREGEERERCLTRQVQCFPLERT